MHLVTQRQPGLIARRADANVRRARPIRLLRQGWIELSGCLRTGLSVPDMKTYLTASLIALFAAVACTTEVLVTMEVEVTREVVVTREVEVTRQVEVDAAPEPTELCSDYPYITRLGELQLAIYDSHLAVGRREIPSDESVGHMRILRDRLATGLQSSLVNRIQICGVQPEPIGLIARDAGSGFGRDPIQREMQTFEGTSVCSETLFLIRTVYRSSGGLEDTPREIINAVSSAILGYVDFCDNDFLE